MIQGIDDKLNYFELSDKVSQEGWNIPNISYVEEHIDNIPFKRVWVSDAVNNEYIDTKHYVYNTETKLTTATYNTELVDSVVIIEEVI